MKLNCYKIEWPQIPFVLARIYFNQGFAYQLISALQIPWLCCFNALYLKKI